MTRPTRHAYRTGAADPLTDSAVHRFAMGTQVRLHLHGGTYVDCGLLDISGAATWRDLVEMVQRGIPIEVLGPRRHGFGGGVVLRVECTSDPLPPAP